MLTASHVRSWHRDELMGTVGVVTEILGLLLQLRKEREREFKILMLAFKK